MPDIQPERERDHADRKEEQIRVRTQPDIGEIPKRHLALGLRNEIKPVLLQTEGGIAIACGRCAGHSSVLRLSNPDVRCIDDLTSADSKYRLVAVQGEGQ